VGHIDWHQEDGPFAVAYLDGTIKLGWIEKESHIVACKAHETGINNIKWDPRGILLASISPDNTCKIWKLSDDKLVLLHMLIVSHKPTSLLWSPLVGEGPTPLLIAIGTDYGTVNVWKLPNEENKHNKVPVLVMNAQGHPNNSVSSLSIDKTGLLLASGCLEGLVGVVNIWSLHDGSLVHTLTGNGGVYSNGMCWLDPTTTSQ
uniref:Probable E3 ubiquitin-protein ligase HERC1 n=1 Tax=Diabrotica virgifera virgifera TaxID=50390 RepID=A0A6P7HCS2_DIAVI